MPLRYGSPTRRGLALGVDYGLFVVPGVMGLWFLGGHQLFSAAWHLVIYKQASARSLGPFDPEKLFSGAASTTAVVRLALVCGLVLAGLTAWVVYRVGALAWRGATIGKWVFGLKVVCEESPHRPPPFRRALGRWAVPQAVGVLPLPGTSLLVYVWALKEPRHQGGHDKAARTLVIRHRPALAATTCRRCSGPDGAGETHSPELVSAGPSR